jgi:hypothetical protein
MFLKGDGSSKDDYLVSRQEPAKMGEQEPFFVAFCQKKIPLLCSMIVGAEFGWVKLGNESRVCCVCKMVIMLVTGPM